MPERLPSLSSGRRRSTPDFALTQETAPLVADIRRRLYGLPLAIELAVARLKLFALPVLKLSRNAETLRGFGVLDLLWIFN